MSAIYESIPQRVEAEQFDGLDVTAIRLLAGQENVSFGDGHLLVRTEGGWRDVFPGWLVARRAGGTLLVISAVSAAEDWKRADESHAGT